MIRLVAARIFHARLRPHRNAFRYRATYLTIPIRAFLPGRPGALLSIDRANLFSLRTRDYGDGVSPPGDWIARILAEWNLPEADGEIVLMTIPRVLGYAFNPVSFWFCCDRAGGLRAVLAEVNNTFRERHSYICFHADRRPIEARDVLTARKLFHVSPFIAVKGEYCFRFSNAPDRVAVTIDLSDEDGLLLKTSVAGAARPLTAARLFGTLLANPFLPLKVALLIHYQAVKLFLKRVRHCRKPPAPAVSISH